MHIYKTRRNAMCIREHTKTPNVSTILSRIKNHVHLTVETSYSENTLARCLALVRLTHRTHSELQVFTMERTHTHTTSQQTQTSSRHRHNLNSLHKHKALQFPSHAPPKQYMHVHVVGNTSLSTTSPVLKFKSPLPIPWKRIKAPCSPRLRKGYSHSRHEG